MALFICNLTPPLGGQTICNLTIPYVVGGGEPEISPVEKLIFNNVFILILKELHDELDAVAAAAYGWLVDLPEYEVLVRSFKQGKKCEARVAATLASLTRTGFIAAKQDATAFAFRRAG